MTGRPRTFDELTKQEALALLRDYVGKRETYITELQSQMRRPGSAGIDLDFDRSSLVDVWMWFLATQQRPGGPVSDEQMRASDPPWWYDFYSPLGRNVGPTVARLVSPIAAYFSETIVRARPASTWTLGSRRDDPGLQRAPVLAVDGGRRFLPDAVVLTYAARWARGEPAQRDILSSLFGIYTGIPFAAVHADSSMPYSIARGRADDFETEIVFDEEVAAEDYLIDRLVERLAPVHGIDRVVREDREVVLVRAPTVDDETLRSTVDSLWRKASVDR
jgi:hypothetical protein